MSRGTASRAPVQKTSIRSQSTVPRMQESNASPWRIGQNVAHAKFGSGVIINCEGHGADARVQVQFSRAGTKWLSLEYAKLVAA